MERKDFRIINSKEDLANVKYVKSKALKICFGERTLILEKIYLGEGTFEYVISEGEDGIKTVGTLDDAKSFILETLDIPVVTDTVTEEVFEEEEIIEKTEEVPLETLTEIEPVLTEIDETALFILPSKKEIRAEKRKIRQLKRSIRREKIKKFFIVVLNVVIGLLLAAVAINFIIEYIANR